MVLPYLQRVGWVDTPPPCDVGPRISRVLEAAGDRLKTAGDILQFGEFFLSDDALPYDEKVFSKRLREPAGAVGLLERLEARLAAADPFEAETLEKIVQQFVTDEQIKIGDIIHALRVAVTGKGVGLGMFAAMAILGKDACLRRMKRARDRVRTSAT